MSHGGLSEPVARRSRSWRARLMAVVVAAALAWPSLADAHTLDELLRLPLEHLLQLPITARRIDLALPFNRADRAASRRPTGDAP